jgi:FkbM family methyltransferase
MPLRNWARYVVLGHRLRPLAADRRSRLALVWLGATTLLRSRRPHGRAVRMRIRLGGRVYTVALRTRTELDVLSEIGIDGIYEPAAAIPARTIVDLGANVGLATLSLLASHPEARVLAVEADPLLIPRLRQNVEGLPVTVVHAAVCGVDGERDLFRSDMHAWGNSLDQVEESQEAVRVPATTVDSLLDQAGFERVDLLKLDIEGAEWEIFAAGVPERIGAIIGEAHTRGGQAASAFVDLLRPQMEIDLDEPGETQAAFLAHRRDAQPAS